MRSRWLHVGQVLFFAFLWTEKKSRSVKNQKENGTNIQKILTELAWSIKDLLYGIKNTGLRRNFIAGTKRAIPSGQYRPILPAIVGLTRNYKRILGFKTYARVFEGMLGFTRVY